MDLAKKLQLPPDSPVFVVNIPKGLKLEIKTIKKTDPKAPVLVFVKDTKSLNSVGEPAITAAKADQLSWIAYPKAGKLETDLNRDKLVQFLKPHGIQGVRLVNIDDTWSAMRFRPIAGKA